MHFYAGSINLKLIVYSLSNRVVFLVKCQDFFLLEAVGFAALFQLFVTKNGVLCSQVQKNFQELCHGDPVAVHHVAMEKDHLPHKLQVYV